MIFILYPLDKLAGVNYIKQNTNAQYVPLQIDKPMLFS